MSSKLAKAIVDDRILQQTLRRKVNNSAIAALVLSLPTCLATYADEPVVSESDSTMSAVDLEFFESKVRPILIAQCYECHSGAERNGGLLLDSREAILVGGDSGTAAVPGDADQSLIIEAVRYNNHDLQMPPQNKLSSSDIAVLEQWVTKGLPDPRVAPSGQAATTQGHQPAGMTIEEGRQFWSFTPIADPAIPDVANHAWISSPIDAFVLRKLEEEQLTPAKPADKRSLIRRVTFNLTGLPPTVEEVAAFLADDEANAFEKIVDRLLDSPQYGVRWGRHWLDVARYADSNGLDENLAYGNAWRYRDYVINAFNSDKPFDQFLTEQLAGDLLPNATDETRIATGFLSLGAKVLAEPDMEKLVMDTIDEQIDTTGKAFLGLTLGCVRCHDHKFDPVKQTDYYALAAIFKSTRTFAETKTGVIKHWYEHSFATEEEKKAISAIDAEIKKRSSAAAAYKNAAFAELREHARKHAADYLKTAVALPPMASLTEANAIAEPAGLHPRILLHCRTHLEYHKFDELFSAWHRLKARGAEAVYQHYQQLFAKADTADTAAPSDDADPGDPVLLLAAKMALDDKTGFLAVPPKVEYAFDQTTLTEYNRLETIAREFESQAADQRAAMGVTDQQIMTSVPIHIRGSHLNLGDAVEREFPEVMRVGTERSEFPDNESGRLQLARWLVGDHHPLTARVIVNRIWGWHFGSAIVSSTENFGRLGSPPSHPELLDWLANRFRKSGWKIKELHRTLLLSSVYQMSTTSDVESAGQKVDPKNRWLWKFRLQRLSAEQLRDGLLAVSGRLDVSLGGKTVPLRNRQFVFNHTSVDHTRYDSLRRAVYLPVIRNNVYSLFTQFDFPDPTMPTGHRSATTVAPQALLMMNADEVIESASTLAAQILEQTSNVTQRCRLLYESILGRTPSRREQDRAIAFVSGLNTAAHTRQRAIAPLPDDDRSTKETNAETNAAPLVKHFDGVSELEAWSVFCQSLLASNEFMYVR